MICIPSKVCKRIFTDDPNAKNVCIAITYFVKAQLVQFSNDAFRTAWTGLNAIYRIFRKDDSEVENRQLDRLIEKLNMTTTVSSQGKVKEKSSSYKKASIMILSYKKSFWQRI